MDTNEHASKHTSGFVFICVHSWLNALASVGALIFWVTGAYATDLPPLPVQVVDVAVPAAAGASSASLATGADGTVWLTWLESAADKPTVLRCAVLDRATAAWSSPLTLTTNPNLLASQADVPALVVGTDGRLTAAWPVGAAGDHSKHTGHAASSTVYFSQSGDRGVTWTAPGLLSVESTANEFVSLQPLRGGRVLAAWLDGRNKHSDNGRQQLFARVIGEQGPDRLVDASVCDCCQTTLTGFPDGSALLAYRGRTDAEIRDIQVARFADGQWRAGRALNSDQWHIAACPVNGPQLASSGGRAAAAWFTAAGGEAHVLATITPDAGARFLQPVRVDRGHAIGKVDSVMLNDGTVYVTWLEAADRRSSLWLQRITANLELGQAAELTPPGTASVVGFPRLAVVKEYDASPGQLAVSYAVKGELRTLLVTLPDASTLAGRKPCAPCDEADALAARGYPLRGRVVTVLRERNSIVVRHEEIPGVMRAMTMEFRADPDVLASAQPDKELLGRIERREKAWWIFGVKWLEAKP